MMNSCDIAKKLRARYSGHEWSMAFEVSEKTGGRGRRCDCIAMSVWPSKGLHLHGHEVKVSRGDWLNEINDPEKSAAFTKRCHFWWIVAPKGIVNLEELPSNWGLMTCSEKSALRVRRPATKVDPEPVSWAFLASLFRSFSNQGVAEKSAADAYKRGWDAGSKNEKGRLARDHTIRSLQRELREYKEAIDGFEAASGIKIQSYSGASLGRVVSQVRSIQGGGDIEHHVTSGLKALEAIQSVIAVNSKGE